MYVAITRAKRFLHLSYSDTRSNYGQQERCQKSQFIAEIPRQLVHVANENEPVYQPPKKKINAQQMSPSLKTGFTTGKNLLNLPKWNNKRNK